MTITYGKGAENAMTRLLALAALFLAFVAPAAAQTFPARGTAPVVDAANIIDPATMAEFSAKLVSFEQSNQRQFVVATIPDLEGYDIADYGYRLGRHWALGDRERNDGIILLVAPNERKVRIEVGYGLEAIMPDGLAYDIIEQDIVPRFRAGDMPGGILAGADKIIAHLQLPPEEARQIALEAGRKHRQPDGSEIAGAIIWFVIILFFVTVFARRNRARGYRRGGLGGAVGHILLWKALNAASRGSRRSSGSWGGGGFSGGGGFGGFSGGGGSFGGGGASGSW